LSDNTTPHCKHKQTGLSKYQFGPRARGVSALCAHPLEIRSPERYRQTRDGWKNKPLNDERQYFENGRRYITVDQ